MTLTTKLIKFGLKSINYIRSNYCCWGTESVLKVKFSLRWCNKIDKADERMDKQNELSQ